MVLNEIFPNSESVIYERSVLDPVERVVLNARRSMHMSPWAINNGWCFGFATKLERLLGPEAKVVSTTGHPGVFPGHWVVLYRGKYYDAESPEGVRDMKNLAYSKRLMAIVNAPKDEDDE